MLDADVTGIAGTVSVRWGGHSASAAFVADGETAFTLPVADARAVNELEITAELTATLNVPRPPMLQTVHHPARTDVYTRRVTCRCGESTTTKTVRIYVHHPEHVRATEHRRADVTRTRPETVPVVSDLGLGTDAPYRACTCPRPASPAEGGAGAGGRFQRWSWLWPGD